MSPPAPLLEVTERLQHALADAARRALGTELPEVGLTVPPNPSLGDYASAACLPLARELKRAPRDIAKAVVEAAGAIPGVARLEVAGPGYVNAFLDRKTLLRTLLRELETAPPPVRDIHDAPRADPSRPKVTIEHTNINPNKAAHVGHLRNAVLGDCLARLLQHAGTPVEVQNYIDDTGVQVADVVVGFTSMEGRTPEQALTHVDELIERRGRLLDPRQGPRDPAQRPFDHVCWDVYAAVGRWLAEDAARLDLRRKALHAMEAGEGPLAQLGRRIALAIVSCHLRMLDRIGVRYHLLPWESDVLAARFWHDAFERLKASGAVHLVSSGKNSGCWVMPLTDTDEFRNLEDPDKVIVRGDGTVTYVGKDIALQLWKFGLLGADFKYRPFHDYGGGKVLWTTDSRAGSRDDHPPFGKASTVYNVIDVRQSYLQAIVKNALLLTGHADQAERSIHYDYEMVALTPSTAAALGFELSDEERRAPYIEMSGRKGLGVKAEDLLERLSSDAHARVAQANADRELGLSDDELRRTAEDVAVGALRYYMAKVTRSRVIAFDIDEALQFQGETGPYLQYSAVRAASIFRKLDAEGHDTAAMLGPALDCEDFDILRDDATWTLVLAAARLPEVVERARASLEIAHLAKHAFETCQAWSAFYRDNKILHAESDSLRRQRVAVARVFLLAHRQLMGLLGVPEPERM